MIVGIVIGACAGVLLLVAAIIALIIFIIFRRRGTKYSYFVHDTQNEGSFLKTGQEIMTAAEDDFTTQRHEFDPSDNEDDIPPPDFDEDQFGGDEDFEVAVIDE
jgi:hypothetical protein